MTTTMIANGPITLRAREEGSGEPVVLLHGLADGLDTFWESGWAGALEGYRLVAFDARGHGGSTRSHAPEDYADVACVTDVLAVLDSLRIARAHVVGYSMGGWTALRLVDLAPDRVASLAIGGAHPYGQSLETLRFLLRDGVGEFVRIVEKARPLPAGVRARMLANDADALRALVARDRAALSATGVRSIRARTLVWVGENDPASPAATMFAGELVNATALAIPGAEHFAAFDHPLAIEAVRRHIAADVSAHRRLTASSSRAASSMTKV